MPKLAHTVTDTLRKHVSYELECIDRMYLNVYVPILQTAAGVAHYIRQVLQKPMASTALLAPKSKGFVQAIDKFVRDKGIDVVRFGKGQRKDDITQQYLQQWGGREGVMYVGKAQEKTRTIRTYRKVNPETGQSYPWLHDTTARVNHYYFYCRDEDFGPIFIKFGSYFPYNAKLCINGHEYLKCQLDKEGIEYEALDNGIRSCENPERAQQIADELSAAKIDALMRKWLRRLPHPFSAQDRDAGIVYDVSMLQAEFALTQVFDRPQNGRILFEDIIRENIDLAPTKCS